MKNFILLSVLITLAFLFGDVKSMALQPGVFNMGTLVTNNNASFQYTTSTANPSLLIELLGEVATSPLFVNMEFQPQIPLVFSPNSGVISSSGQQEFGPHSYGSPCPNDVTPGIISINVFNVNQLAAEFSIRILEMDAELSENEILVDNSGFPVPSSQRAYRNFFIDVPTGEDTLRIFVRKSREEETAANPVLRVRAGDCVERVNGIDIFDYTTLVPQEETAVSIITITTSSSPPLQPGNRYYLSVLSDSPIGSVFEYRSGACFGDDCQVDLFQAVVPGESSTDPDASNESSGAISQFFLNIYVVVILVILIGINDYRMNPV